MKLDDFQACANPTLSLFQIVTTINERSCLPLSKQKKKHSAFKNTVPSQLEYQLKITEPIMYRRSSIISNDIA